MKEPYKTILGIMAIMMTMALMLVLVGCGDTTTNTQSVSVSCGDGGCGDVIIGDGNEVHKGEEYQADATSSVEFDLDNYDAKLSQRECNDLNFFFCTIENKCLPQPLNSGSCPN